MTDLTPALSAEEWARGEVLDEASEGLVISDGNLVCLYDAGIYGLALDPFKTLALANAALPDTDPRKITRADVELLKDDGHPGADVYHSGQPCCDPVVRESHLRTLAAKLAALLPPAGPEG